MATELSSTEEKLKFIFNMYDTDGNGQIDRAELRESLRAEIQSTGIHISEEKLSYLTSSFFDVADGDGDGGICFEEFKAGLERYPDVIDTLTQRATSKIKVPSNSGLRWNIYRYVVNNTQMVIFLFLYFAFNIVFFGRRAYFHYKENDNGFYIVARACGHCLNFNGAMVLVLMLRKTLSFLRATPLYNVLPFDHTVSLHKLIGIVIALLALGHTGAHVGNGVLVANATTNFTLVEFLLTDPSLTPLGLIPGTAFITGWMMTGLLIILLIGAMPCVRESGLFQVFSWTHWICFSSIYVLYIMHGPHFWKWFIGPCLIYLLEKFSQSTLIKTFRHGATYIKQARLLPSGVTHLVITRPPKLQYRAGDFIYVRIPVIAEYEWHPFTISSAPEETNISIHVQSRGTWTKRLYAHFSQLGLRSRTARERRADTITQGVVNSGFALENKSRRDTITQAVVNSDFKIPSRNDDNQQQDTHLDFDLKSRRKMRVFIQGPYGTPSTSTFTADHAVLIGGGIGVTPFAAIVKSIMCQYRRYQQTCPNCQHTWTRNLPQDVLKVKKVDFVWINRSPTAFEWFVKMLSELEEEQGDSHLGHFLDIHLYMTAMRRADVKSVGLQMALDAAHETHQKDALTGLKTKLKPGRPDWETLFQSLHDQHKGKVEIFFCGSSLLGRTVRSYCRKHGFRFHKEVF